MADDTKDLLKQVSNELARVSDEFTKKADEALKEVKNAGKLSDETKRVVDEMAVTQTALTGTVEELKARLGEVEQVSTRRGGGSDPEAAKSVGAQLIDGIKANADLTSSLKNIQANKRFSVPVSNALISTGVATGVVEPQQRPADLRELHAGTAALEPRYAQPRKPDPAERDRQLPSGCCDGW